MDDSTRGKPGKGGAHGFAGRLKPDHTMWNMVVVALLAAGAVSGLQTLIGWWACLIALAAGAVLIPLAHDG